MFTKKITLLILMFWLSSFSLVEIVAQKDNKIGVGINFGNTWGYKRSDKSNYSRGLKLYYERKISYSVGFRGNIDLLLSDFYNLSLDGTVMYNILNGMDYRLNLGVGIGYYLYNNHHGNIAGHGYFISEDEFLSTQIIDAGVVGFNAIVSVDFQDIPFEIKFILSPYTGDEYISNHSNGTREKRITTTYIKNLLFSIAIPFYF
ncbi:MAG: hypothetical protein GY936_12060 [Ignavibacteriae bacterium]|nr:hypothetical protein [Ignavibacteriota bacterium]